MALVINNAIIIALLLVQVLLLVALQLARLSKFIRIILFIVYVGGIIILITYSVILIPDRKFTIIKVETTLLLLFFYILPSLLIKRHDTYSYGLLFRGGAILLLGLLLYIVIVVAVDVIDYSRGTIKT